MSVTVVDVCRELEVEPTPALTWAVGAAMRAWYERQAGELPPKALRPKTNGAGTHCHAVYPERMRGKIAELIRAHGGEQARQRALDLNEGQT